MRIAFIVDHFPTLSETFIINQITGMIDRGHQVHIFAHGFKPANTLTHPEIEAYSLLERTTYFPKPPRSRLIRITGNLRLFTHILITRWTSVFILAKHLLKSPTLFIRHLCSAKVFTEQRTFDVIHCHYGPNGNLAVFLREVGIISGKITVVFHGYDMSYHLVEQGNQVYNQLFQKADLMLPVSEKWKKRLIQLGCDPTKIKVHHMGIDLNKFQFEQRGHQTKQSCELLTVARLVRKKGVEYAIRAVAELVKRNSNLKYTIVGDGPLKQDLTDLVHQLHVHPCVELVGWKGHDEIVSLLRKADLFLAPSVIGDKSDEEGIPVVLMEAMASGLPVISTPQGGIPELVQDGVSGYLVDEGNVQAIASQIQFLIDHQELWFELSRNSREQVKRQHNIEKLNDELEAIFSTLICED